MLLPEVHSTCLKKHFGREPKDYFLLNLSIWELKLFSWWQQKRFSRVWRRFSGVEWLNFWSISLDFVQKLSANVVLLSKIHSQGFVKVTHFEKKVFLLNFECKNIGQCCWKRELRGQFFRRKSKKRQVSLDIAQKVSSRCCQRCSLIVRKVV